MIFSPWQQRRLMVPRWRSLQLTLKSKELASPRATPIGGETRKLSAELRFRLESWRREPTVISAAELVEIAIVDSEEEEAIEAARSLVAQDSRAVPLVQQLAAMLLRRRGRDADVPGHIKPEPQITANIWRHRTKLEPHNPIAWVELSLNQTIYGHLAHAARSMTAALQLAPHNRHVLRSAARLFLRMGNPERAHETILKSPATSNDPWLIASEIALSELANKSPTYFKRGIAMLEGGRFLPRQTTELAGSIATTELIDGSRKKARKFFNSSMTDPNGNALAQAEWASPLFGTELFSSFQLGAVEEAFEAQAFHRYREGNFGAVPSICDAWADNEPYSIRPHELGAASASVIEEYEKVDEIARWGLRIRPGASSLVNSRAFALASMGRTDEAEKILKSMSQNAPAIGRLVATANYGLIAFRRGHVEEGKAQYQLAIEGFQRADLTLLALFARAYLAREAAIARIPEAEMMIRTTRDAVQQSNFPAVKYVFRRAELALAANETKAQLGATGAPT